MNWLVLILFVERESKIAVDAKIVLAARLLVKTELILEVVLAVIESATKVLIFATTVVTVCTFICPVLMTPACRKRVLILCICARPLLIELAISFVTWKVLTVKELTDSELMKASCVNRVLVWSCPELIEDA